MEYTIIYEFWPKLTQIYMLLIPIAIIVVGLIGFRMIRKYGYIRLPLMPQNPFTQPYMNKVVELFIFLIIMFGVVAFVGLSIRITKEFNIQREIKSSLQKKIIISEELKFRDTSIYDNIRLKRNFVVNGQFYKFANTANEFGSDWPPENHIQTKNSVQEFRISYINLDHENLILKIEEKNF